ncbi:MAG: hypothetical protein FRX48_06560 [Lasallia pustulata]|uniref:Actin binding protein n=1 Tax=Lasallia pustulata TaxID=136370 RepID=A0A5M8PMM0_9LECA|nr:MAG: hypothetical protein FRX48_06560 [Lasallia pustulata]
MATLNLSTNGPSISKSYQSIVNSPPPSGTAAQSPTYGQWAVYSVSAPLVNAFQQDAGGKESTLKVQSTGEGELIDLIDEFSDGRVQFAFVKVKDPNTSLPKYVLIGWCGEGVPERTKGYFTSHLAKVSKTLHGYHVQVAARSDRDITPEGIIQKISDASGSKYSGGSAPTGAGGPPPPVLSKPAFTPTRSSGGTSGFNPLASSRGGMNKSGDTNVDEDGWGQDAPPVTRTQLEKVQPAYQPTRVNMRELSSQKQEPSRFNGRRGNDGADTGDVVKGGYQPVGKVDIAALRRQAQDSGSTKGDRPDVVKGSYEPVGKVDIAAIRARAQQPSGGATSPPSSISPAVTGISVQGSDRGEEQRSHADRSAPFSTSERLTSLPKPKVSNRFGPNAPTFTGTKAPTPSGSGLETKASAGIAPIGVGRTFADEGGKSPAQLWAEKKARERGLSGAGDNQPSAGIRGPASPITSQTSGGGEWKSGYGGKSWAPVQTTVTGKSASSIGQQHTGQDEELQEEAPTSPVGGVSAIRDRFRGAPPMGAAAPSSSRAATSPPPLDTTTKPNAGRGIPIPGLPTRPAQPPDEDDEPTAPRMPSPPPQPPRSPSPPTPPSMESGSPIRVAMPVARGPVPEVEDARDEQFSPPPAMPVRSLAQSIPHEADLTDEPTGYDPARGAGAATAATSSFGHEAAPAVPHAAAHEGGKRALVQYDYEKAEDNELELKEGEYVDHIEMVDDDWWMGRNSQGESGLFPSNYVELVDHLAAQEPAPAGAAPPAGLPAGAAGSAPAPQKSGAGPTATALYDYEAAEDNELSFPEGARVESLEFPDEDWWSGEYGGRGGLFPANYVQLDE